MSDTTSPDIVLPDDLVALHRAALDLNRQVQQLVVEGDADVRARFDSDEAYEASRADPERYQERLWSEEMSERLVDLRGKRSAAASAVRGHPVMEQALAERRYWPVRDALNAAVTD